MSIELGKSKNWGSRSGNTKIQKMTTENPLIYLPDDLLLEIAKTSSSFSKDAVFILETKNRMFAEAKKVSLKKSLKTKLGTLYKGDCLTFLNSLDDGTVDCFFADPPFNLSKTYSGSRDDNMTELDYLLWSKEWLSLCVRKLKPGGSLFIYNIPKWSIPIGSILKGQLDFKSWIAVDLTLSLPIAKRLYPSHYSLLYFTKGSPTIFNPPRIPMDTCIKCGHEQHDYGGYKLKMNPEGLTLRDIWTDIPPVRHSKYKNRDANELSIKLLDRVLDISTVEGSLVVDPFGGSGTTYAAAELKNRKWLGVELGDCDPIINRLQNKSVDTALLHKYESEKNTLFTDKALLLRKKSSLPLDNYRISDQQLEKLFGKKISKSNLDL